MNRRRRIRGMMLVELLAATTVTLLIGAALYALMQTTYNSRSDVTNANQSYVAARQSLDILADNIRDGQAFVSNNKSTVIPFADGTDVRFYTDNTGNNWITYSYNSARKTLQKVVTTAGVGGAATDVVLNVQSVSFTYFVSDGGYNALTRSAWTQTNTPDSLAGVVDVYTKIAAVQISATVNVGGYSRTLTSFARMRNSPRIN